ncbi:MAG: bifunctional diaminohydroxyphosphoribosylaminopyrimidine deaminase/5-amino-6-(5-phosphoribosylamino)uracil reductase RibD [Planctomycetales bacterium]|nr:bifunctional diaminohydroxyphosphoribosylaminopyrimidine deaminase/5-amino-6-(5-phosphoribosylamino)uracil reductase RibD [Planctomycetales bacterium]
MNETEVDAQWMSHALHLAARGADARHLALLVGCVLVAPQGGHAAGELLGEGFHTRFGGPHAEREAIADAERRGEQNRLRGATAYVTLEPCCHFGKTPPCTQALIDCGVARVVAAMRDPFERVRGQGIELLQAAGLQVQVGVQEAAARELNAPYIKRLQQQRPWVIAKWAMSLDGRIATRSGHSKWISGKESRATVQQLRGRVDAILIGSGTALADDPLLTARTESPPPRTALRVVADSRLSTPLTSQLVHTAEHTPVLFWAGPEATAAQAEALRERGCLVHISPQQQAQRRLDDLLHTLAVEYQATNLLVEGGGNLLGSLFDLQQIDQIEVFLAPKIIGGGEALSPLLGLGCDLLEQGPRCHITQVQPSGEDTHLSGRLHWHRAEGETRCTESPAVY